MRELRYYHELEDLFEEQLNDCYETVSICGYDYDAGRALRLIDEIGFRCEVSNWYGEEYDEIGKSDMTAEEIERYMPSDETVMYCRKGE